MTVELERLALACLLPSFPGDEPPAWILRRLDQGLGGLCLFSYNTADLEQLAALTRALRARRPGLLIGIDEEGGDVTRLETGRGSSYPGNGALGAVDDVALTVRVAAAIGAELAAVGVNLDFAPVADVNVNPANPVIGDSLLRLRPGARRPPRRGVRGRPAGTGGRGLRQALPRPRLDRAGLAPGAAGRDR